MRPKTLRFPHRSLFAVLLPEFREFSPICTGHARRATHRENRRRNHLSDARDVRPHRSSSAKINYFRQRHRLRRAPPAQDHPRNGDLVLRRSCPHGKKAASKTPMRDYVDGCRATWISTGHPTRKSRRSSSRRTSRPVNASGSRRHPRLDCRAWKGRPNPLLLSSLRFAPESRDPADCEWRDRRSLPPPPPISIRSPSPRGSRFVDRALQDAGCRSRFACTIHQTQTNSLRDKL